jgi:DNA polymerase-3 subunit beta
MKFTVTEGLAEAVAHAASAIVARPVQPVLASMRITAARGEAEFTGSDYYTTAMATVPADVAEPGTVIVPGRLLAEVARRLPGGKPVTFTLGGSAGEASETMVTVECGSAEFFIVTADPDEYPVLPEPGQVLGTVAADLLAQAVGRAVVTVSRDDGNPALAAIRMVLCDGCDDRIGMLTTDKYKAASISIPWVPAAPVTGLPPLLVPGRRLAALVRTIPSEQDVEILARIPSALTGADLDALTVTFAAAGRSLTCRLVAGEFPVSIEKKFATAATVTTAVMGRKALTAATELVAVISDRNRPVRMHLDAGQARLGAGGGTGRGGDMLDVSLDGPPVLWAAFNPDYLRELLEAAGTKTVAFRFAGEGQPVLVTDGAPDHDDSQDDSFQFLVMPWREESAPAQEQKGESR